MRSAAHANPKRQRGREATYQSRASRALSLFCTTRVAWVVFTVFCRSFAAPHAAVCTRGAATMHGINAAASKTQSSPRMVTGEWLG